jgi:hypothetical protein
VFDDEAQRAWDVKPEGINVHEKIEATTWFLKEGMTAAAPDATALSKGPSRPAVVPLQLDITH